MTDLLNAIDQGKPQAANQLVPLLYDELRRLAAARLADESPGQTLDATALVHEAYIRLVGDQAFENRRHFFAAAAEAMRRVLVDRARARLSLKRGRDRRRVDVSDIAAPEPEEQLFALDAALSQLARDDPLAARVVELHHFAGMRHDQVAAALELSIYQVRQKWGFARAWLKAALEET
jgi:RNA polymerase sigma factor (TIGR02999 family)